MRRIFGFLILLSIAIGCSNDDGTPTPSGPVDVFKIAAETDAFKNFAEVWFVAWDDDGTLLDYGKFVNGQTLTLTTEETITNDKVTLGYFRYRTAGGEETNQTIIFTDFTPGSEILFKVLPTGGASFGNFKLTVFNEPVGGFANISSKKGGSSFTGGGNSEEMIYNATMEVGETKFIMNYSSYPDLYHEFSVDGDGDEVEIDFNDFKNYEKHVTVNLPDDYSFASIFFRGHEGDLSAGGGYTLAHVFLNETGQSTYTMGYIPSVTQFSLNLQANYKGAQVNYVKYGGAIPANIAWPDPSKFTVTFKDPNAFSVSVTEPVEYIVGSWSGEGENFTAGLTVFSSNLSPKVGPVPAEMITSHPRYEIKKELYSSSRITFMTKGSRSFEDSRASYFSKQASTYDETSVVILED